MDWQTIAGIISSVGFPIAACAALYYYMLQMLKEHKQDNKELREEHKAEIAALSATLDGLKEAILELKGSFKMATYVKVKLSATNGIPALKETVKLINYTINTINGKYGNGDDRKKPWASIMQTSRRSSITCTLIT